MRTFVLPRAANDTITRIVFSIVRKLFNLRLRKNQTYERKDRILALYAPVSLLILPPVWLTLTTIAYTFIYWATGIEDWVEAFTISGSSVLTLGYAKGTTLVHTLLSFSGATIGLIMVTLLISYLPTMYTAFSRRESMVNQLEIRADTPPSPVEMLMRYQRLERLHLMGPFWEEWERWFVDIEESHTSLGALVFFRSPLPDHNWVNAAGAVMDAAALRLAMVALTDDIDSKNMRDGQKAPGDPRAAIAIRAGFIALRRISDFFGVEYNHDPHFPEDSISISREEFDLVYKILAAQGLPLIPNSDKVWQDFAGWRVNYDSVLRAMKIITNAPEAPWITPNTESFIASILEDEKSK
ncbi:MAG: hypothetical protein N2D54_08170 [Chloroflexota bacterium]